MFQLFFSSDIKNFSASGCSMEKCFLYCIKDPCRTSHRTQNDNLKPLFVNLHLFGYVMEACTFLMSLITIQKHTYLSRSVYPRSTSCKSYTFHRPHALPKKSSSLVVWNCTHTWRPEFRSQNKSYGIFVNEPWIIIFSGVIGRRALQLRYYSMAMKFVLQWLCPLLYYAAGPCWIRPGDFADFVCPWGSILLPLDLPASNTNPKNTEMEE